MAAVVDVEGIGPVYAQKLVDAGVRTTDALLRAGATRAGREDLAERTGIGAALVLEWVNHCDLMRVKGVGSEYADLLEAAGVDSVPELAQRSAENLTAKLEEVNAAKKLVRRVPAGSEVARWVAEAATLERVVTH